MRPLLYTFLFFTFFREFIWVPDLGCSRYSLGKNIYFLKRSRFPIPLLFKRRTCRFYINSISRFMYCSSISGHSFSSVFYNRLLLYILFQIQNYSLFCIILTFETSTALSKWKLKWSINVCFIEKNVYYLFIEVILHKI